jgi:hypothetical protein
VVFWNSACSICKTVRHFQVVKNKTQSHPGLYLGEL